VALPHIIYPPGFPWPLSFYGAGAGSNVTPDSHPLIATPFDDEFEEPSLDAKWTWVNQGTSTAVVAQGACIMTSEAAAAESHRIIQQSIAAASFKVRTKCQLFGQGAYNGAGLVVGNSGSGKYYALGIYYTSTAIDCRWYVKALTNPTTLSSNLALGSAESILSSVNGQAPPAYLEFEYDGTNVIARISMSGYNTTFAQLYTATAASWLGTPDTIGINVDAENATLPAIAAFDWFRRIS